MVVFVKRFLAMIALYMVAGVFGAASAEAEERSDVDPRLGDTVNRICFARNIDGWRAPPDGYDRAVLLERGANNWYLAQLHGGCQSRDFRFAGLTIGLDTRPRGGCVRRGDAIIVSRGGGFTKRCFIDQINAWDDDAKPPTNDDENKTGEETERKE